MCLYVYRTYNQVEKCCSPKDKCCLQHTVNMEHFVKTGGSAWPHWGEASSISFSLTL